MIGNGRASIAQICDISRANIADGLGAPAIQAIASLGAGGVHPANQERDLHTWVKSFVSLEPFAVNMTLNAASSKLVSRKHVA